MPERLYEVILSHFQARTQSTALEENLAELKNLIHKKADLAKITSLVNELQKALSGELICKVTRDAVTEELDQLNQVYLHPKHRH